MIILIDDPEQGEAVGQLVADHLATGEQVISISDQALAQLPIFAQLQQHASLATRVCSAHLRDASAEDALFACILTFGDGTASRMLDLRDSAGRAVVVVIVDLRYAYECLAHISVSPLGRYSPSLSHSVAIEKLSLATRVAAMREASFFHLSLGLLSEAQDQLYGGDAKIDQFHLDHLLQRSFLSGEQVSMVLQAAVHLQVFHEYGHFVCRHQPPTRTNLEGNLSRYITVYSNNLGHRSFHDSQNAKLAQEMLGDTEFDLILTAETAPREYARLIAARLTARYDKEELLCDDFAVQNTAKQLVDRARLGSADWLLARYCIEYVLLSAWGLQSSRRIFAAACETWNRRAVGDLTEIDREAATERLEALIADRKALVINQRLRLQYALEQFDTVLTALLHGALGSTLHVRDAFERIGPSSSMARILQEFSGRHVNLIDRSIYTIEGLGACSSRGRAMRLLASPGELTAPDRIGDVFSFYILGTAPHLDLTSSIER
ncbi:MAG: hypothetical protein ABS76_28295 [Pelagibacterium sp. SCN 64-44]|nr:MAG: hypothetical protein ABS76_28295 [Pelagibacterium sp. SCN 64-44]